MSEIKAKLGVDTSSVPADLAKGKAHFEKFGHEVAESGHNHGANYGEHLVDGITKKLGAHHLSGALATALGLNVEKIADHIAAAFAGGTAEGWKEAQTIIDENAALIEKKLIAAMTPKQLGEHLQKELEKAVEKLSSYRPERSFAQNLGIGDNQLNAEQLAEQQALQKAVLEREEALREFQKKDKEGVLELTKAERERYEQGLKGEEKIYALSQDALKVFLATNQEGLTAGERAKLITELNEKNQKVLEAKKSLEEDVNKELEKQFGEIEKAGKAREEQAKKEEARLKHLSELRMTSAEQEKKVAEDAAKLSDRSKLTIGELSQITNAKPKEKSGLDLSFGVDADLTQEQRELKKKAQEAQEAEQRVEELRKAGRVGEADEALKKLDEMKGALVDSGFVKSTEDPSKALVEQLHLDTEKLNKTLGEIRDISKGKFVNE